jgi:hypothetical protein
VGVHRLAAHPQAAVVAVEVVHPADLPARVAAEEGEEESVEEEVVAGAGVDGGDVMAKDVHGGRDDEDGVGEEEMIVTRERRVGEVEIGGTEIAEGDGEEVEVVTIVMTMVNSERDIIVLVVTDTDGVVIMDIKEVGAHRIEPKVRTITVGIIENWSLQAIIISTVIIPTVLDRAETASIPRESTLLIINRVPGDSDWQTNHHREVHGSIQTDREVADLEAAELKAVTLSEATLYPTPKRNIKKHNLFLTKSWTLKISKVSTPCHLHRRFLHAVKTFRARANWTTRAIARDLEWETRSSFRILLVALEEVVLVQGIGAI